MGSGIAAACVKRELPVTITDARPEALAAGVQKALEEVSYNKATRGPDAQKMLKFAPLDSTPRRPTPSSPACDLVIEVIVENAASQARVCTPAIEPQLKPDAILATNTSAISIALLAAEPEAARSGFCRHPLLQPRAADAAGRSDPRPADQRRDRRHGRGFCQGDWQVADRRQRRTGLSGQSSAAAVHERGAGTAARTASRSSRSRRRPKSSACRWVR